MNIKHKKTLAGVFHGPFLASVVWKDIESMFFALGAEIKKAVASSITVELNAVVGLFHRPHVRMKMGKGFLKSTRRFLIEAGVRP